jgi:hypothetical protein
MSSVTTAASRVQMSTSEVGDERILVRRLVSPTTMSGL